MTSASQLQGSCACERFQYTILIPPAETSSAQVFFDNSAANRRSQAAPVTAWLRIPLEWYHSSTYSFYPDETHSSIRRTYNSPSAHPSLPPTRRQFCGYCGTHLTSWTENHTHAADSIDVTLGSLLSESVEQLAKLDIIPQSGEQSPVQLDDSISTNDEDMGGAEEPQQVQVRQTVSGAMRNRGMPYFEEMVENSRLGRIKRQKGGHVSSDGRVRVEWEVLEIDEMPSFGSTLGEVEEESNKRQKIGV